jgi:hypothetical protein
LETTMTSTRGATTVQQMMERAQAALHRNQWFEAERMSMRALEMARAARDFTLMARITLPLQEARRQRLQLAFDANNFRIVDEPFGEEVRVDAGCYLVQPPLVGADARRLRLAALDQEVPAAILCREPLTKTRLCPIVAIGQLTIRTKIAPPKHWDHPTLDWLAAALEALGDAAIETLDRDCDPIRLVDALLARLDGLPDHEKLHQELAHACREAARAIAEGRVSAQGDQPAADAFEEDAEVDPLIDQADEDEPTK